MSKSSSPSSLASLEPDQCDPDVSVQLPLLVSLEKLESLKELDKLIELSKLDQLKELDGLKRLHELKSLEQLDKLSHLSALKELGQLSELEKLNKLKALEELRSLDKLTELTQLDQLAQLSSLEKLDRLKELKQLSKLEVIHKLEVALNEHQNVLAPLEKLSLLEKLESLQSLVLLDRLTELRRLDELTHLDQLEKLKNLTLLGELDNLKNLRRLDEMKNLDELRRLDDLKSLDKLSELGQLKNLDKLAGLDKLDRIDDAKFAERLERLDKLDILKKESKKLLIQQIAGTFLEILKFIVAGICILVVLSTEKGQRITSKALPALGFGNAAQTNLGLHMLIGQLSSDDFGDIVNEIRKKIQYEISVIYSSDSIIGPVKRLALLRQVKGYAFASMGVDLKQETELKLKEKNQQLLVEALEALDYSLSQAIAQANAQEERALREIKILLMNKKYVEVLQQVLPKWQQGDAMVRSGLVSIIGLETEAPEVLDKLINSPIVSNEIGDK